MPEKISPKTQIIPDDKPLPLPLYMNTLHARFHAVGFTADDIQDIQVKLRRAVPDWAEQMRKTDRATDFAKLINIGPFCEERRKIFLRDRLAFLIGLGLVNEPRADAPGVDTPRANEPTPAPR